MLRDTYSAVSVSETLETALVALPVLLTFVLQNDSLHGLAHGVPELLVLLADDDQEPSTLAIE